MGRADYGRHELWTYGGHMAATAFDFVELSKHTWLREREFTGREQYRQHRKNISSSQCKGHVSSNQKAFCLKKQSCCWNTKIQKHIS